MAFSVNSNIGAYKAYNALAQVNAQTEKAQLRLASTKKINSVADDTSGFNIGKKLEAQVLTQKAQLNNVASAKNYLATAESALQQINDKINQIASKYTDSQDPLKDQASIAKDISTLAGEIDSILKNTKINDTQILANGNRTTLADATAATRGFSVGGEEFLVDFGNDGTMDTTDLFGKTADLTLGASNGAAAAAAGNTDARAYIVATFIPAVQIKMGEVTGGAADANLFETTFLTSYDSEIALGHGVNLALQTALTAGDGAVGTNVAAAIAQGTGTSGTALYDDAAALAAVETGYTDAAGARAAANTLMANIATKLTEYGVSASQIQAFSTAFGGHMASVVDADLGVDTDALAEVTLALADGAAALTTAVNGHTLQDLIDTATARGVQTTGTAAMNLATQQQTLLTEYSDGVSTYNGLHPLGNVTADIILAAADVTDAAAGIRSALGRIGNLSQSIDSRADYLTAAISNNTASVASIFDADMAAEQLNATKGQISGQIATAMLSQMNQAPQNLLSLFR